MKTKNKSQARIAIHHPLVTRPRPGTGPTSKVTVRFGQVASMTKREIVIPSTFNAPFRGPENWRWCGLRLRWDALSEWKEYPYFHNPPDSTVSAHVVRLVTFHWTNKWLSCVTTWGFSQGYWWHRTCEGQFAVWSFGSYKSYGDPLLIFEKYTYINLSSCLNWFEAFPDCSIFGDFTFIGVSLTFQHALSPFLCFVRRPSFGESYNRKQCLLC